MNHTYFDTSWEFATKQADSNDEIVEHGWEQHVILDHANQLVYRYPRNQAAADKLADEVDLLTVLHTQTWPIAIPKMRELTEQYAVYDLIEGDVLTPEKLCAISSNQLAEIGRALGLFLAQLHNFNPDVIHRKKTKQSMTLLEYYAKRIEHGKDTDYYLSAKNDLENLMPEPPISHVVVHGDLHGLNMVVEPTSNVLVGIIDFSEVELGDTHQDFRKLFMTDERLLRPAVESYAKATNKQLSIKRIRTWAYVNEWANVCYFAKKPHHPTYVRALNHLNQWHKI